MFNHPLLALAGKLFSGSVATSAASKTSAPAVPAPLSAEQILMPNAALLHRIRAAYGCTDDQFARHILAPISALAEWLHTLPALPDSGFEYPGGAIGQAMTHCLCCLQAADGLTFSDVNVLATPDSALKWRLGCALGGLFAALPQLLCCIEVASTNGHLWPSTVVPLQEWLAHHPTPKYRHRWKSVTNDAHAPITYIACRCIRPDVMAYLSARGEPHIGEALLSSISDPCSATSRASPISELIGRIKMPIAERRRPQASPSIDKRHPEQSTQEQAPCAVATCGVEDVEAGTDGADPTRAIPASIAVGEADSLSLDTSAITNSFLRERLEETVARLDQSFDTMLAKCMPTGIFVALSEFSAGEADSSAIVRALVQGGCLATDPLAPNRRVTREHVGDADAAGIVLASAKLSGFSRWQGRWQTSLPIEQSQLQLVW